MKRINIRGPIIQNDSKWIYNWFECDATCPKDIEKGLEEAEGDKVEILINSGGGIVTAAVDIYEAIRSYTGEVIIKVIFAASAATVIAEAAESEISPAAMFMVHNARSAAQGDYRDMDHASEMLKKANASITEAYMEKTGMKQEELFSLMDKETYMTAKEAVEYGFIDRISKNKNYESKNGTQAEDGNNIINSVTMIPDTVLNKVRSIFKNQEVNNKELYSVKDTAPFIINKIQDGGKKMTLNELLKEYPEANEEYQKTLNKAREEGEREERERMKNIDAIAKALPEELVAAAKYDEIMSAEKLSMQAVMQQMKAGKEYLENAIKDTSPGSHISAVPADTDNGAETAIDRIAGAANRRRGKLNGTVNE